MTKKENKNINEFSNIVDERSPQDRLNEIALDAIGRLETLENVLYIAKQTEEYETLLNNTFLFKILLEETSQIIFKKLNSFLLDNGFIIREDY